jgi:hypothetical protein
VPLGSIRARQERKKQVQRVNQMAQCPKDLSAARHISGVGPGRQVEQKPNERTPAGMELAGGGHETGSAGNMREGVSATEPRPMISQTAASVGSAHDSKVFNQQARLNPARDDGADEPAIRKARSPG